MPPPDAAETRVVCVDFGSTFTKAALVDAATGELLATASHPTTLPDAGGDGDVLDGYDACLAALAEQDPGAIDADVLACSSAGGGLRIAVVGNEELVTAEAGRRVALSSGGKVVLVLHGGLDATGLERLRAAEPDVVLLVGGTDGGNAEVLEGDARFLSDVPWPGPVVVAGNVESQPVVAELLAASGTPHVLADNVVPRIGVLAPDGARRAIREIFLSHVIGGKHLSSRTDARGRTFTDMVRGATPDVVLTGVELLARGLDDEHPGAGDVVVVDVGGATTDVHSVVELDPEDSGLAREVVATTPVTRTVEGDLGMRWSAISTVEAAGRDDLHEAAVRRRERPDLLPDSDAEQEADLAIAAAAVRIALERHAGRSKVVVSPEGRVVERSGKDLREVDLLVGSGGALRHGGPDAVRRVLVPATGDAFEGGWQLPRAPRVVVDHDYVLAAAGLLAADHPVAAHRLLGGLRATGGSVA
ncbi:glutamate mutase L [Nocardioides sp. zg-1228]|uniref:glutamate mutase L n=1 Tax=Nocardioides sp. zg-1228 TaxID=2763008 RepID=UPI0016424836|nr:glutamate mutase L [Nocardioides sp. zg-1228]MBC2932840.1 glutamate mutase L [Nocardioides sp. zg-1228]QSF56945.1 glutamate mutase L [Nocardioides sp. zg-1228]